MKLIIFLTTFSFVCVSISQNLILNGDFEDFSKCPKGLHLQEKQKTLKFVSNPNQGSFDFTNVMMINIHVINGEHNRLKAEKGLLELVFF